MKIKNKSNKVILLIFILIINILFSNVSFAMVKPTNDFYVNDYADLLDSETKEYIIDMNKKLNSKTGAQIVVVTIPSLEGDTLESYATALFRSFGIGDKNKNNGVLLLLALKERQFRVEVGYGLEGTLTDGKTGRIQDEYIIPYLKHNNWNDGIKNGFNAILSEVEKEYNIELGSEQAVLVEADKSELSDTEALLITLLFFTWFIAPIILGMVLSTLETKKKIKKKNRIITILIYMIFDFIVFYGFLSNATNALEALPFVIMFELFRTFIALVRWK